MVTLAQYLDFIRNYMQIPIFALPDNSPSILTSLAIAQDIVNCDIAIVGHCNNNSNLGYTGPTLYEFAVYNLAADFLINFTQDQPGQDYFSELRKKFGINNFVPGVINSAADESTSESLVTPEFMSTFTMSDLQRLKTPYGRRYLEIVQGYGTLWGIS